MLHGLSFYGGFAGLSELERRHLEEELQRGAFILHFSGPDKPWRLLNRGRNAARFSDYRFFDYLQRSNWFGRVDDINALMEETWREDNEWIKALTRSAHALEDVIPEGDSFILVDEATWPVGILDHRSAIPFLEANGRYAGIPPDDVTAIREFERLRAAGARYIVFVEPALWWLEYLATSVGI